ncbi:hypothetical protein HanPI659440_Chr15g0614521 [Helianthus annuus]|nr:hypothetical protein HanPI659440_Chr15g0614521 [Helianthus annuus]
MLKLQLCECRFVKLLGLDCADCYYAFNRWGLGSGRWLWTVVGVWLGLGWGGDGWTTWLGVWLGLGWWFCVDQLSVKSEVAVDGCGGGGGGGGGRWEIVVVVVVDEG